MQAIRGPSAGDSGVFSVKQKISGRKESPPLGEGGLEGGEMGSKEPIHRHCRLRTGIGECNSKTARVLLI